MEKSATIQYWLEMADYDLETAKAMLRTERYLYVGFMAHQCVEKGLKALIWKKSGKEPPYIHDLWKLANAIGLDPSSDIEKSNLLDDLTPLNIEARYPKAKDRLLASLTREICIDLLDRSQRMLEWIKTQL